MAIRRGRGCSAGACVRRVLVGDDLRESESSLIGWRCLVREKMIGRAASRSSHGVVSGSGWIGHVKVGCTDARWCCGLFSLPGFELTLTQAGRVDDDGCDRARFRLGVGRWDSFDLTVGAGSAASAYRAPCWSVFWPCSSMCLMMTQVGSWQERAVYGYREGPYNNPRRRAERCGQGCRSLDTGE